MPGPEDQGEAARGVFIEAGRRVGDTSRKKRWRHIIGSLLRRFRLASGQELRWDAETNLGRRSTPGNMPPGKPAD